MKLSIPELLGELDALRTELPPGDDPAWPFMLSAGERRSFTANTIIRDPSWRKLDTDIALRVSPSDAARIGVVDGGQARLTTKRASAIVAVRAKIAIRGSARRGTRAFRRGSRRFLTDVDSRSP